MNSTIKIDIDEQGFPMIVITKAGDGSDLRDKTLRRFIEGLGYESNLLHIGKPNHGDSQVYHIRPINEVSLDPNYLCHNNVRHLWERIGSALCLTETVYPGSVEAPYWSDMNGNIYDLTLFGFVKRPPEVATGYLGTISFNKLSTTTVSKNKGTPTIHDGDTSTAKE